MRLIRRGKERTFHTAHHADGENNALMPVRRGGLGDLREGAEGVT